MIPNCNTNADINSSAIHSTVRMSSSSSHAIVHAENIPAEMREIRHWIGFRLEWNDERSKFNKIPYSTHGNYKASSTNSAHWGTFDQAQRAMERFGYDGLGFVFTGSGYFGVDLDHCIEDGVIADWAQVIIDSFATYTEFSISGTGVHIIGKGTMPGKGRKRGDIEAYSTDRFFTMSGNVVAGAVETVEDRQAELTAFVARAFGDQPKVKTAMQVRSSQPMTESSMASMLDKARNSKNGSTFTALYDRGDLSGHNNDASSADMALCCRLAYWFDNDFADIDSAFRSSALMRDKWDERRGEWTYGERTITQAQAMTPNTYNATFALRRPPKNGRHSVPGDTPAQEEPSAIGNVDPDGDAYVALITDALSDIPVTLGRGAMSLTVADDISDADYQRLFYTLNNLRKRVDVPIKCLLADAYWQIGRDRDGQRIPGSRGMKKDWVEATFHDLAGQIAKWASVMSRWPAHLREPQDEHGNYLPWSFFEKNRNLPDQEKQRLVEQALQSNAKAQRAAHEARREAGQVTIPRTLMDRVRRLVADRGEDYLESILTLASTGQIDELLGMSDNLGKGAPSDTPPEPAPKGAPAQPDLGYEEEPADDGETFHILPVDIRSGMFLDSDAPPADDDPFQDGETFQLECFSLCPSWKNSDISPCEDGTGASSAAPVPKIDAFAMLSPYQRLIHQAQEHPNSLPDVPIPLSQGIVLALPHDRTVQKSVAEIRRMAAMPFPPPPRCFQPHLDVLAALQAALESPPVALAA